MLKKIIWLGILAMLGFGVYEIGPYVASRYRAYMAEKTAKMAVQVNQQAQDMASPATTGAVNKAREVQQKMDQLERNQP